jgi:hypothetical protein
MKCKQCGLVNFVSDEYCKRCQASLSSAAVEEASSGEPVELAALSEPVRELAPFADKPRLILSPLRILMIVLVIIGAVWYQVNRDETARAAQLKNDKEFDDKRRIEDERAHPNPLFH